MDLLLKTQIGRYEATFEDFAIQRELAPLLSDVLARNTIRFFEKFFTYNHTIDKIFTEKKKIIIYIKFKIK